MNEEHSEGGLKLSKYSFKENMRTRWAAQRLWIFLAVLGSHLKWISSVGEEAIKHYSPSVTLPSQYGIAQYNSIDI